MSRVERELAGLAENVGKKPTRQRFVLRSGTEPDPETGIVILTRMPHRHISCEEQVSRARHAAALEIACVPTWSLRAPIISDWDTSE